jgi:hypothetical protein
MTAERKLYIEYRVYFNPTTNQELLKEVAERAQEEIYKLFNDELWSVDYSSMPPPHDITYEIVMEISDGMEIVK